MSEGFKLYSDNGHSEEKLKPFIYCHI